MPRRLTFTFTSHLEDLRFEPVEINRPPWVPGVERLRLEVDDTRKLTIHCEILDPRDQNDAQRLVGEVVEQVLDLLALDFDSAVAEARLADCQVSDRTEDDIYDVVYAQDSVSVTVEVQPERVIAALSKGVSLTPDHRIYRLACAQTDPTVRFLLLYQLLLMIHDDKQKQVDDFILNQAPGTPRERSRKPNAKPDATETVYTWLRNDLAHTRKNHDGKTPVDTAAAIHVVEQWVGQLQDLVRGALEIKSQSGGGISHP